MMGTAQSAPDEGLLRCRRVADSCRSRGFRGNRFGKPLPGVRKRSGQWCFPLQQRPGIGVGQLLGFRYCLNGQVTPVGIEPLHQGGIGPAGRLRTKIGNLQRIGHGGPGEGQMEVRGTAPGMLATE